MAIMTATLYPEAIGRDALTLGGVVFQDFELPENLRFNPTQNCHIHKFIGGTRQIDVLGEDADTIKWAGTFLGPDAMERADTLNEMCIAGDEYDLTWGMWDENVVIKQVAFDYKGPYRIDYSIECYTLPDVAGGGEAGGGAAAQAALNNAGFNPAVDNGFA